MASVIRDNENGIRVLHDYETAATSTTVYGPTTGTKTTSQGTYVTRVKFTVEHNGEPVACVTIEPSPPVGPERPARVRVEQSEWVTDPGVVAEIAQVVTDVAEIAEQERLAA